MIYHDSRFFLIVLLTYGASTHAVQIIGSNSGEGILIINQSTGNSVGSNWIGTDVTQQKNLGNGGAGVSVQVRSSYNAIGTDAYNTVAGNIIANNLKGVVIGDNRLDESVGNTIINNSIFNNQLIGIDLANDGMTPNHAVNPTTGPNDFQNFPVLSNLRVTTTGVSVDWNLHSQPNTPFLLQFFTNLVGDAEGKLLVTQTNTTTDAAGNAFGVISIGGIALNSAITATATNSVTGDTSEFGSIVYGPSLVCVSQGCR